VLLIVEALELEQLTALDRLSTSLPCCLTMLGSSTWKSEFYCDAFWVYCIHVLASYKNSVFLLFLFL